MQLAPPDSRVSGAGPSWHSLPSASVETRLCGSSWARGEEPSLGLPTQTSVRSGRPSPEGESVFRSAHSVLRSPCGCVHRAFCVLIGSCLSSLLPAYLLDVEKDTHTHTSLPGSQPASEGQTHAPRLSPDCPGPAPPSHPAVSRGPRQGSLRNTHSLLVDLEEGRV